MSTIRQTATALTLVTALALGVSACGDKDAAASPTSSTPSVNPTEAAKADAFAKSEAALRKVEKMPANGQIKEADYLTPDYLAQSNATAKEIADHGAKVVGAAKFESITPLQYGTRPKPTTSMRVCSVGDLRLIDLKTGKDITVDENQKPKPKGVARDAAIYYLESNDGGKTFQLNDIETDGKC